MLYIKVIANNDGKNENKFDELSYTSSSAANLDYSYMSSAMGRLLILFKRLWSKRYGL